MIKRKILLSILRLWLLGDKRRMCRKCSRYYLKRYLLRGYCPYCRSRR